MEADLATLRKMCDALFVHLEGSGIEVVEIPVDYYWFIPAPEVYDPYIEPTELTLGQLSFDWTELLAVLEGDRPILGYHLVWLASLLRAVGEQVKG